MRQEVPYVAVYVGGAGPVGLACAASAQLLGAACVIVGDMIPERLAQARSFGCETVDISDATPLPEQIRAILGVPEVDAAVDCVGFEARGCGHNHGKEVPAQVLNDCMTVTAAGGAVGIPGLYVTEDPGAADDAAKFGNLSMRLGLGWAKSLSFATGQCPVMKYHRNLMQAILFDKIAIDKAVGVEVISLDDAPRGYADFDKGASKKFVIGACRRRPLFSLSSILAETVVTQRQYTMNRVTTWGRHHLTCSLPHPPPKRCRPS